MQLYFSDNYIIYYAVRRVTVINAKTKQEITLSEANSKAFMKRLDYEAERDCNDNEYELEVDELCSQYMEFAIANKHMIPEIGGFTKESN